jgi:hypothetical protein
VEKSIEKRQFIGKETQMISIHEKVLKGWCMPMWIPALRRQRQEDCEFKASLDYDTLSQKQKQKQKNPQNLKLIV